MTKNVLPSWSLHSRRGREKISIYIIKNVCNTLEDNCYGEKWSRVRENQSLRELSYNFK